MSVPTQEPAIDEVVKQSIAALAAKVGDVGSAIVALQPHGPQVKLPSAEATAQAAKATVQAAEAIAKVIDESAAPGAKKWERRNNGLI